ncbi:MAG: PAS domain S-box protein [Chloroflexi bacterium]|nr:PAS domain S-box protein [Chloroflexota bacterium]
MTIQKTFIEHKLQPASDLPTFQLMFESHPAVMLLIEPETGRIREANPAAVRFYGYPKLNLCGMLISEINSLSFEPLVDKDQTILDDRHANTVYLHRLASGEERNVEVLSSALILQGEQLFFCIVTDITEHKRAEAALLNLQKYRASDLFSLNEEIASQNEEKEKLAAELITANKALDLQNAKNIKPAAELVIANQELVF